MAYSCYKLKGKKLLFSRFGFVRAYFMEEEAFL